MFVVDVYCGYFSRIVFSWRALVTFGGWNRFCQNSSHFLHFLILGTILPGI